MLFGLTCSVPIMLMVPNRIEAIARGGKTDGVLSGLERELQIGRASCRERV